MSCIWFTVKIMHVAVTNNCLYLIRLERAFMNQIFFPPGDRVVHWRGLLVDGGHEMNGRPRALCHVCEITQPSVPRAVADGRKIRG